MYYESRNSTGQSAGEVGDTHQFLIIQTGSGQGWQAGLGFSRLQSLKNKSQSLGGRKFSSNDKYCGRVDHTTSKFNSTRWDCSDLEGFCFLFVKTKLFISKTHNFGLLKFILNSKLTLRTWRSIKIKKVLELSVSLFTLQFSDKVGSDHFYGRYQTLSDIIWVLYEGTFVMR